MSNAPVSATSLAYHADAENEGRGSPSGAGTLVELCAVRQPRMT